MWKLKCLALFIFLASCLGGMSPVAAKSIVIDDPSVGIDDDSRSSDAVASEPAPVFERAKLQRMYENVLEELQSMQVENASVNSPDDWFVVGGLVRGEARFNQFQGAEYVAKRVVEFVDLNDNRCRWRVFKRVADETTAKQEVNDIRKEHERLVAQEARNQRSRQQAGSRKTDRGAATRSAGRGSARGGSRGSRGGGRRSSGGC